ncbi:MAG: IS21 family transposase [bacterium]|nr:IS21 family transposase [bacterium]
MEHQKCGTIEAAAMKANMTPKTAAKYIHLGELPSAQVKERDWRTREDPFESIWLEVEAKLEEAPTLQGKALFEWFCEQYPGVFQEGQLRTFQRKIKQWRATDGPSKEVYFPQVHHPGKRLSFDFTHMDSLEVTIAGKPFPHLLFHAVLTYSNWQWIRICHSESLLALRSGIQSTFLQLGHLPKEIWSDHSSAATHKIGAVQPGERAFNERYLELTDHFGVTPRTIQVNSPHENGDVESANGAFKSRVNQHLLLRGSRDFEDLDTYRVFLEQIVHKANRMRSDKLAEEMAVMRPLKERLLHEYEEKIARVTSWSTVNINRKTYSVPSRLIGEKMKVRLYEDHVEVWFAGALQERITRMPGCNHQINYRHVIDWLLRKPGAFRNYKYHKDLFPRLQFRKAYDELCDVLPQRKADLEYLRILKQAAYNSENDVCEALEMLHELALLPTFHHVEEFLPQHELAIPEMEVFAVNLSSYDQLIEGAHHEG